MNVIQIILASQCAFLPAKKRKVCVVFTNGMFIRYKKQVSGLQKSQPWKHLPSH